MVIVRLTKITEENLEQVIKAMGWDSVSEFMESTNLGSRAVLGTYVDMGKETFDYVEKIETSVSMEKVSLLSIVDNRVWFELESLPVDRDGNAYIEEETYMERIT